MNVRNVNYEGTNVRALDCESAEPLLQAFHDGELPVEEQIAVAAHIEWCGRCAASIADLRTVSTLFDALSAVNNDRVGLNRDGSDALTATVVSRLKAENDASLLARVRDMFDDIRLVYAGLGAAAATVVCVMVMLGMMRYATRERPDSLAAIVTLVATPLECESNDAVDAAGCRARWEARFHRANESAQQDSVFEIDAAVTRQTGQLADLGLLRSGRRGAVSQAHMIEAMLDSVNRSRLEVSRAKGGVVPASVLWLLERATVRATAIKPALETIGPPPLKKRADSIRIPALAVRA